MPKPPATIPGPLPTTINLPSEDLAALAALPTPELLEELSESLRLTARSLMRLALTVRVLEERGEDLSDLRIGLLGYLRLIAHGQVVPEAVVRYAEFPSLLHKIARLPLPDQRKLASGEPVPMVVRRPDGSTDRRLIDPLKLRTDQVRQVIGPNGLRDEAEQVLFLQDLSDRPRKARSAPRVGRLVIDRRRGGLILGRSFFPLAEVVEALAVFSDPDSEPEPDEGESTISVRVAQEEHRRLKQLALDGQTNVSQLIRRALHATGLLGSSPTE